MPCDIGAKKPGWNRAKPIEVLKRGNCPCSSFLRCSTRQPYGVQVWCDPMKAKQACDAIAYNSEAPPVPVASHVAQYMAKACSYKGYYKTIEILDNPGVKVMIFPKLNAAGLPARIKKLESKISNGGEFTPFQKSLILRANLVKNGLVMKSDIYTDRKGKVTYKKEKLIAYSGGLLGKEWNIDHIQTRAKGGCNRFCNAALLSSGSNIKGKHDDGLGCPCVDAVGKGKGPTVEGANDFKYSGKKIEKYNLFQCATFTQNKKDNAEKLPNKPLGYIKRYKAKKLCNLDNPMIFDPNIYENMKKRAVKICEGGK